MRNGFQRSWNVVNFWQSSPLIVSFLYLVLDAHHVSLILTEKVDALHAAFSVFKYLFDLLYEYV